MQTLGYGSCLNPLPPFVPLWPLEQLSSAGVERNAYIGDDAKARAKDIPIVKANPGGILNFKYEGEQVIRASRLAYTIIRPTGDPSTRSANPFIEA